MSNENDERRLITFDKFMPNTCIENIFGWSPKKILSFRNFDKVTREPVFLNYKSLGNVEIRECRRRTSNYEIEARANQWAVRKSGGRMGMGEEEKYSGDGFVYDGTLWIIPKPITPENYGVGGRILCWVPSEIDCLEKLIKGDVSDGDFDERISAIRESYIRQRIESRNARHNAINHATEEGIRSGRWFEQHGYPEF